MSKVQMQILASARGWIKSQSEQRDIIKGHLKTATGADREFYEASLAIVESTIRDFEGLVAKVEGDTPK